MIPHLHEHFGYVGKPKLARVMLPQAVKLARSDLVTLDAVLLAMEGAHVFDEAAGDGGR